MNLLRKILLVILLFASTNVFAQLPYNNLGFENGTFDDWETAIGYRDYYSGVITMDPVGAPSSRHIIINDKNSTDPYGDFPVLCPNGSKYSIKLGDDNSKTNPTRIGNSGRVQRISRTFIVPANFSLIFNYAVVLEDNRNASNAHDAHIQPKFEMRVVDLSSNTVLTCPYFDFTASSTLPGFLTSTRNRNPDAEVIYKDWSTALINLNNYAGKEIRIEFTATDCAPGAHFGYAYLDIDEVLSLNPISGNIFCKGQTYSTLIGPSGFKEYTWYNDKDLNTSISDKQNLVVKAEPNESYTLKIVPYDNSTCVDFLHITLQELPDSFILKVAPKVFGCPGTGIDLTAASIKAGSSVMKLYSYYKDEFGQQYLPNPDKVLQSGTYYIRGTNVGGCTDIQPIEVVLSSPEISVTQPFPVRYPTKVDLSTTFADLGFDYRYYSDAAGTIEIDKDVNVTGTYYIKATSGIPCSVIVPVKVIVNPPPPYTIEAPNTFTPNGDGVNDFFKIKIDGFVSLTQLTIFNRYGQQVFTTRSINDYWTGTSSGSALPNGTYYWIFEGKDDYFHTPVKQASSITIIR